MDYKAYLHRIGFHDSIVRPSLEILQSIHEHHLYAIPFENLDISLGRPIELDLGRLEEKILGRRRGGFCYELNGLFAGLLESLGYAVRRLNARVAHAEGGYGIPFDHLALLVTTEEGEYLADVGFGESFIHPVAFAPGATVHQRGVDYRLTEVAEGVLLSRRRRGRESGPEELAFEPCYLFTTESHRLEDFAGACRYHQSSPESSFTQKSILSLARPQGRLTLSGTRRIETVGHGDERLESTIATESDFIASLIMDFGFGEAEAVRCAPLFHREAARHTHSPESVKELGCDS